MALLDRCGPRGSVTVEWDAPGAEDSADGQCDRREEYPEDGRRPPRGRIEEPHYPGDPDGPRGSERYQEDTARTRRGFSPYAGDAEQE